MPPSLPAWRYRIAGLSIASDLPWLEGAPVDDVSAPDLVVMDGHAHGLPRPRADNARTADAARIRFVVDGVGQFLVEEGRRVVAWPDVDADPGLLSQQLAGPSLAMALMQRAVLVLHGAVLRIGQRAIAVIGHSGDGKSTLAAACRAAGHAIVSDDLVVIDRRPDGWSARPVAPLVRLVADTQVSAERGGEWWAGGKRVVPTAAPGDAMGDVTLSGFVSLAWGTGPALTRAMPVEAALVLLERAYCRTVFRPAQAAQALERCSALARELPVWRLTRPLDLSRLAESVALVEHVAATEA